MLRFWILAFGLLVFQSAVKADGAQEAEFWQALQTGGKVLLMRHAEIDRSFGDSFLLDESCFSEKNLNEIGRNQAKSVNQAFKMHGIKIDKVLASPHCRTKETAELAFGRYQVEPLLRLTKALTVEKANDNLQKLRLMIGEYRGQGNLILVTHRPNIGELALIRVEPAEMLVLQPLGDGLFDVIARLKLQ
ncbi:phosphoglycerate mutase [Thiomicrorhabdus immobilis]|uniref:Phosphoglycerate mutase n=1 Tax=Thiomicrorhabdus immobilis TaxID=2791037 RepID=A0ABM7MG22_9GAMM|nr:histidine phosphatase family protein [Thiomicrorhabdus immobilis]BCN94457.1 phosphoglycerate mutase [Thiomicrorhabdus immobilis]